MTQGCCLRFEGFAAKGAREWFRSGCHSRHEQQATLRCGNQESTSRVLIPRLPLLILSHVLSRMPTHRLSTQIASSVALQLSPPAIIDNSRPIPPQTPLSGVDRLCYISCETMGRSGVHLATATSCRTIFRKLT